MLAGTGRSMWCTVALHSGSEKVVLGWVLSSVDKFVLTVVRKLSVALAVGGLWELSNLPHSRAQRLIFRQGSPGLDSRKETEVL